MYLKVTMNSDFDHWRSQKVTFKVKNIVSSKMYKDLKLCLRFPSLALIHAKRSLSKNENVRF